MDPIVPWIFAICLATVAEWFSPDERQVFVVSFMESMTTILVKDGVVAVRAVSMEGRLVVVVDCSRMPDDQIPGDLVGLPVRVRVDDRMGGSDPLQVQAARAFVRDVVVAGGRVVPSPTKGEDGEGMDFIRRSGDEAQVMVSGMDPSTAGHVCRTCTDRFGGVDSASEDGVVFSFRPTEALQG